MRGGVSLAVWIGGACGEIDELRRGEGFWGELTRAVGFSRVAVDVMAGASAGGLNAVLFGASIRNGFPMTGLGPIWNEVASVDRLRRTEAPWLSLFNGDASFLRVIRDELAQQVHGHCSHPEGREPGLVDVQLSATLVEPLRIMAPSPADERLTRTRSSARFHFRHDAVTGVDRHDFDATPTNLARLALGARSTSSFPAAFEPALVPSSRPRAFGEADPEVGPAPDLVDCRGVFSESGAEFVVADGGIVDNIPLGKALEAVAAAPASGPTRRVLVYLHPSGPSPMPPSPTAPEAQAEPDRRRRVRAVAAGAKAAVIQEESIDGDLERLEFLNRAARVARVTRAATSACFGTDLRAGAASAWPSYRILRPGADATALRAVLDDPVGALGEDPFPAGLDDDGRWRAPLCYWQPEQRTTLDGDLTVALRERLTGSAPDAALLAVGLSPLRRAVDLLLEWTRALSRWGCDTGTLKADLYGVRSVVNVADRLRRHGWVVRAARGLDGSVAEWCRGSLELVDGLLVSEPSAFDDLDAYRASVQRRLQQLFDEGGIDPVAGTDLRTEAVGVLAGLVERSCRHLTADPPPGDPALLLHQVLTAPEDGWGAADRIAALEVLCLPEFLGGRPGAEELRLVRISAAADTPVASAFPQLVEGTRAVDRRHQAEGRRDGWEDRLDFLRPEVKLAGNELSNFSAFLDARWRDNDWMWGRLDAVSGLVEILLGHLAPEDVTDELRRCAGGAPDGASLDELRRRLIRIRQEEVLRERWGDGWQTTAATYDIGLETVNRPGSPAIRDSLVELTAVASRVVGEELPGPLRGLASVAGHVARFVVGRLARPRGPSRSDTETAARGGSLGLRTASWLVPLLSVVFLWIVAWLWVENDLARFVIGMVCGVLLGAAALLALLFVVLWDHPPKPRSRPG